LQKKVKVSRPLYWEVRLKDIRVGDESLNACSDENPCKAVVRSATQCEAFFVAPLRSATQYEAFFVAPLRSATQCEAFFCRSFT
jgi:hypothetical protein